jgi:hypothetical protein
MRGPLILALAALVLAQECPFRHDEGINFDRPNNLGSPAPATMLHPLPQLSQLSDPSSDAWATITCFPEDAGTNDAFEGYLLLFKRQGGTGTVTFESLIELLSTTDIGVADVVKIIDTSSLDTDNVDVGAKTHTLGWTNAVPALTGSDYNLWADQGPCWDSYYIHTTEPTLTVGEKYQWLHPHYCVNLDDNIEVTVASLPGDHAADGMGG